MSKYDDLVIDIELDEPSRSSPALGQIDKLLKQSAMETQSLQVVRRILMREMLERAQVTGVSKLTAAAKHRQALLPPSTTNGHEYLDDAPTRPKKKRKQHTPRESPEARIDAVRRFLEQHPGSDTNTIAAGLGWRPGLALKFAAEVATKTRQGHRQPVIWHLKRATEKSPKTAAPSLTVRRAKGQASEEIRAYLRKHPEALTKDVADALRRTANSSLIKAIRSVARPVRPTNGTQPIQWVLSA